MSLRTLIKAVGASLLCSLAAHAAYFKWEAIELPAASGASCGNGSPYRFFVNRTPFTSKTVVMYEGGGACWEKGACENKAGVQLGAVNPNGVPSNYMSDIKTQAHLGLVTPFTTRINPFTAVQTQSWNIVYMTYCTGDVHVGNTVQAYSDEAGAIAWYHRGSANVKAATAWMAANMPKPAHLLVTGFSAGHRCDGQLRTNAPWFEACEKCLVCRLRPAVLGAQRQYPRAIAFIAFAQQDP